MGIASYAKDVKVEAKGNKEGVTKSAGMKSEEGMTKEGKFVTGAGAFTFKTKDIIRAQVENREGKSLGTINDLEGDPKTGRVVFAVIAHGGAFGIGEKNIAVPLKALSLKTDDNGKIKMFVLNMNEERFANAPSFDKDSWPDKRSAQRSYRYFGLTPYWSGDHTATTDHMKNDRPRKEQNY